MKRKIKFRIWDKEVNEVMRGGGFTFDDYIPINYMFNDFKRFDFMQYTGIKDCEGREIYEGDIIEKEVMELWIKNTELIGVVKMIDGCWCVANDKMKVAEYLWDETDVNRVIGNIYENPKLLED